MQNAVARRDRQPPSGWASDTLDPVSRAGIDPILAERHHGQKAE
jgi:hypothetical protein